MSPSDQFLMFVLKNRVILSISGVACLFFGYIAIASGKKKEKLERDLKDMAARVQHQSKQNAPWVCTKCGAKNPAGCINCQSCSTPKKITINREE